MVWVYFHTKIGQIFEGLGMENVGIFYGHLVLLLKFGILCQEKYGNNRLLKVRAIRKYSINEFLHLVIRHFRL
jgi:DNA-binding transcriptional ArsR family regulator